MWGIQKNWAFLVLTSRNRRLICLNWLKFQRKFAILAEKWQNFRSARKAREKNWYWPITLITLNISFTPMYLHYLHDFKFLLFRFLFSSKLFNLHIMTETMSFMKLLWKNIVNHVWIAVFNNNLISNICMNSLIMWEEQFPIYFMWKLISYHLDHLC